MEPAIGRSLGEGFRAANKSWAGIGFFAGAWIVTVLIAFLGVMVTHPPAELFQQQPVAAPISAPRPAAPAAPATPATSAAPAADSTNTNLFSELDKTGAPVGRAVDTAAPAPETLGLSQAQLTQLEGWLGRSWPVLLLTLLIVVVANLWLTGGQIGYVGKRIATQAAPVSEFWVVGNRSFVSLLLGWLLSLAAGIILVVVVALVVALLAVLSRVIPAGVVIVLGFLLGMAALVGLVWLGVRLALWFLAIVLEKATPVAGLKVSFKATKGRWWKLFGLQLLLGLIGFVVGIVFRIPAMLGALVGGVTAQSMAMLSVILGTLANLYLGFVTLGAIVRFYQDTKSSPAA